LLPLLLGEGWGGVSRIYARGLIRLAPEIVAESGQETKKAGRVGEVHLAHPPSSLMILIIEREDSRSLFSIDLSISRHFLQYQVDECCISRYFALFVTPLDSRRVPK
jgi:hypothetical protein